MIFGNYSIVKIGIIATLLSGFFIFLSSSLLKADAATLIGASNTITTSRPSASSPFSANAATGDTNASIFDNGSFYLASDSAKTVKTATAVLTDVGTIVASQSSALTTVYFAETLGVAAFASADVLFVPITAMHKIQFTIPTTIPNTGDIILTFPSLATGDANNEASPSASTFQFNNMDTLDATLIKILDDDTDITANTTIAASNPSGAGDGPDISITIDTGSIAAGSIVEIFIGCTTVAAGDCSAQTPTLINPTKSAAAGTADVWKIGIQTRDGSDVNLDNATVAVGTIESVTVRATVDPTLSFTITGIANGAAVNLSNTTGCLQDETTNAGIASTATEVNLGLLGNSPLVDAKASNIAAQRINISTNGSGGYVLTATSSGSLINPATGFFLESSTTPTAFPASGADWFGIHACGLDTYNATIGTTFWNTTISDTECGSCPSTSTSCPDASAGTNVCKYGWPTQTSALTLASDSTGPIGNTIAAGNGIISVSYAGGVDALIPPGEYRAVITYVATPTF